MRAGVFADMMLIHTVTDDLCLDYANTLSWRGSATPTDSLHCLADLLDWIERAAGVDQEGSGALRAFARDRQESAARVFTEAIALREAIFRGFSAFTNGEHPHGEDFAALSRAIAAAPARDHLERLNDRYAWRVASPRLSAADIVAPALWSAGDLFLTAQHRRIRRCANARCLWLFVDQSKSGTRRWCDMASCGNQAKARRHYAKTRLH